MDLGLQRKKKSYTSSHPFPGPGRDIWLNSHRHITLYHGATNFKKPSRQVDHGIALLNISIFELQQQRDSLEEVVL